MDFFKYFSYYCQKIMISPCYFGPPVLGDLYVDDVVEEASGAGYQMLKLRYQKELEKFTSERKPVNERQRMKNDERK
jgi:hypothetical protein